ncbi:MSCRAMM family protein [Blastococcus sp. SYSU D01042]
MKQSAVHAPRARWRITALGSLLAVLALALGVVVAPAATAAPKPTALGEVRELTVQLDVTGDLPPGVDRAGAGIRFTSPTHQGTCLTNSSGRCEVDWTSGKSVQGSSTSRLSLPTGLYTVTQPSGLALAGVTPASGDVATVEICKCNRFFLPISKKLTITNDSLYRDAVTARVVDATTGAPVPWATFRLDAPGSTADRYATSDRGGQLTFDGPFSLFPFFLTAPVFLPGDYTLTPVQLDPRYDRAALQVTTTAADVGPRALQLGTVRLGPPPAPELPATGSATLVIETVGTAPSGLDLSGAEFELTGAGTVGTCVTDELGSCSVQVLPDEETSELPLTGAAIALPAGEYEVRQTVAPVGLAAAAEIPLLELCVSIDAEACATTVTVQNASLFRRTVEAEVRRSGVLEQGAEVTLTGPGFVATGSEPGPDDPVTAWPAYETFPMTTDDQGVATFHGWFAPGEWSFAVEGETEPQTFLLETGAEETDDTWRVDLALTPVAEPGGEGDGEGDGGTGSEPTTPATPTTPTTTPAGPTAGTDGTPAAPTPAPSGTPAVPTSPAPVAGATGDPGAAGAGATPGGAGTATARTAPRAGAVTGEVVAPQVEQDPAPQPDAAQPPAPSTGSVPGNSLPGGTTLVAADEAPELQTESDTRLLTAGLVTGVGILFVVLVLTGYSVLRGCARRRP